MSSENAPAVRLICASFCVNFDKRQKISGFELILTSMSGKNKIIKIYTPECWSHILRVSIFFLGEYNPGQHAMLATTV